MKLAVVCCCCCFSEIFNAWCRHPVPELCEKL